MWKSYYLRQEGCMIVWLDQFYGKYIVSLIASTHYIVNGF